MRSWKVLRCSKYLNQCLLLLILYSALAELNTEKISPVMRASLAFHGCSKKDSLNAEFFLTLFWNKSVPVTTIDGMNMCSSFWNTSIMLTPRLSSRSTYWLHLKFSSFRIQVPCSWSKQVKGPEVDSVLYECKSYLVQCAAGDQSVKAAALSRHGQSRNAWGCYDILALLVAQRDKISILHCSRLS